ncbi:glycosyltransferase family 4 protein [Candidatus Azambacteria bacterium]|nr:glycosyltransferase family 4 protein [Candidatus Azambacteria bacterium]
MNILIITQKYDLDDSNLGAFNIWWDKLTGKFGKVFILALEKHSEAQNPNIEVFSMGKEKGLGKIGRLYNFYKNLFKILPHTDLIFVHMIPLYLILAWLPAKIFKNKIVMWYAGVTMNNWVQVAVCLSDKSLTSQEGALRTKSSKRIVIGHGIDVNKFKIKNEKFKINDEITILSIGRITPSKGHDLAIKAVAKLIKNGYDLKLKIIGGIIQSYHQDYLNKLKKMAGELDIEDKVEFTGSVNYDRMPEYYNRAQILIDAVPSGGFDKVILEAMASGVVPLSSNKYVESVFPARLRDELFFENGDEAELIRKLKSIIDKKLWLDKSAMGELRNIVENNYSLNNFINKISSVFNKLVSKNG